MGEIGKGQVDSAVVVADEESADFDGAELKDCQELHDFVLLRRHYFDRNQASAFLQRKAVVRDLVVKSFDLFDTVSMAL